MLGGGGGGPVMPSSVCLTGAGSGFAEGMDLLGGACGAVSPASSLSLSKTWVASSSSSQSMSSLPPDAPAALGVVDGGFAFEAGGGLLGGNIGGTAGRRPLALFEGGPATAGRAPRPGGGGGALFT